MSALTMSLSLVPPYAVSIFAISALPAAVFAAFSVAPVAVAVIPEMSLAISMTTRYKESAWPYSWVLVKPANRPHSFFAAALRSLSEASLGMVIAGLLVTLP